MCTVCTNIRKRISIALCWQFSGTEKCATTSSGEGSPDCGCDFLESNVPSAGVKLPAPFSHPVSQLFSAWALSSDRQTMTQINELHTSGKQIIDGRFESSEHVLHTDIGNKWCLQLLHFILKPVSVLISDQVCTCPHWFKWHADIWCGWLCVKTIV